MSEETCPACQRRVTDELLALSELREVLGVGLRPMASDLPKLVLALRRKAEHVDELASIKVAAFQVAKLMRRHADKISVEAAADALDAILSGRPHDLPK